MPSNKSIHDFIIIGSGVSGSFMADELCRAGLDCLMLEAGRAYSRTEYPITDVDGTSQLYWAGGLELTSDARLGCLRPKVVGGGSVVNQALLDRFDDVAWDLWRSPKGVEFFNTADMAQWYDAAEAELSIQYIPESARNRNALIFEEGFAKMGYKCAPLRRGQSDCDYEGGDDCIACLNGCRRGSKQSMPETVLKKALAAGLKLETRFEALEIAKAQDYYLVKGLDQSRRPAVRKGRRLVLACGAIGNSKLLLASGYGPKNGLPALGHGFYCHPQYNNYGVYDEPVNSHKGPFQSFKSDDPGFRQAGFKLENVYAPPPALALLLPGAGAKHQQIMQTLPYFASIEVCTQDTNPGRIKLGRGGKLVIIKKANEEDKRRRKAGEEAVNNIFTATGAKKIYNCPSAYALHLMGGLSLGLDPANSCVSPDFGLHGHRDLFAADSSVFPSAPGINPSLTIMALSKMAARKILGEANR